MAETKEITLSLYGMPVTVDEEEFGIIRLMVKEAGGDQDLSKITPVIKDLVNQGYIRSRATELCILARDELLKNPR